MGCEAERPQVVSRGDTFWVVQLYVTLATCITDRATSNAGGLYTSPELSAMMCYIQRCTLFCFSTYGACMVCGTSMILWRAWRKRQRMYITLYIYIYTWLELLIMCKQFFLQLWYKARLNEIHLGHDVASSHPGRPSISSSAEASSTGTPKKHPLPKITFRDWYKEVQ